MAKKQRRSTARRDSAKRKRLSLDFQRPDIDLSCLDGLDLRLPNLDAAEFERLMERCEQGASYL